MTLSAEDRAYVDRIVAEEKARLTAEDEAKKPVAQRIKPNHLRGLNLAIARWEAGIPLSRDLQDALEARGDAKRRAHAEGP